MQLLCVGQHGVRLRAEEVGVPDVEEPHEHGDVPLQRGRRDVHVHGVETREELAEGIGPERNRERETDRRVDGIAPADPVPEPERVLRVDAERGDLVERGRDGDEVVRDGVGARRLGSVDRARLREASPQPVAGEPRVGQGLQRRERLGCDDEQRRLGSRSAVFCAASVGSMLEMKRAWIPASAKGRSAS